MQIYSAKAVTQGIKIQSINAKQDRLDLSRCQDSASRMQEIQGESFDPTSRHQPLSFRIKRLGGDDSAQSLICCEYQQ